MTGWSESDLTKPDTGIHKTLVALCQELGWMVNIDKSELNSKQVFDFIDYQLDLKEGKVRPTRAFSDLAWKRYSNALQADLFGS